tara:strand:+ start:824 stop:970 length:147 start_codon:yes stop_codon:yes gene_type:complete
MENLERKIDQNHCHDPAKVKKDFSLKPVVIIYLLKMHWTIGKLNDEIL